MGFRIEDKVFKTIPGLRVLVFIVKDVKCVESSSSMVKEILEVYWREGAAACKSYPNVQSHPQIKAWRDCFQSLGISSKKYPTSVEGLLKRAVKSAEPLSIHPLVDLYNAFSVAYILPFGAFDLDDLPTNVWLELRYTKPFDKFMALDQNESSDVPENEIAYIVESEVVTRHINWRQAKKGLLKEDSKNILFMSEVLKEVPAETVKKIIADFEKRLKDIFDIECVTHILDESNPSINY